MPVGIAQQRRPGLQRHHRQRLPFVQRQQQRESGRARQGDDTHHGLPPLPPRRRRPVEASLGQDILAVEQQSGIDIPGHRQQTAIDSASSQNAGKDIIGDRVIGLQRRNRLQRRKLRYPGVAELDHIRQRITGEGGQQLLMRGAPGDLLHLHPHAGMASLELRRQALHRLPFPTHGPERKRSAGVIRRATRQQAEYQRRANPDGQPGQAVLAHKDQGFGRVKRHRTQALGEFSAQG